jgi:uncharacterized repeat protein (TIGR02543 family)
MKLKIIIFIITLLLSIMFFSCTENDVMFTIHFQPNGGSDVPSVVVTNGVFTMPSDPSKEGHTFQGWFLDDQSFQHAVEFELMDEISTENIILYAKWVKNTYTITYRTNGGNDIDSITLNYHDEIEEVIPYKEGYEFVGWYVNPELNEPFDETIMPAYHLDLYAKWEEQVQYRVIYFDENGGDTITLLRQPIGSDVFEPENVYKEGHTFVGWYVDEALTIPYQFSTMPEESMTIYAKWTVNMCTLWFDENGGEPVEDIHQLFGTPITLPIPTREGYEFNGWYYSSVYFEGTTMPDNITLIAMWDNIYFKIEFISFGVVYWTYHLVYGNYINITHISDPMVEGYTFGGWFMDEQYTIPYDFDQPITTQFNLYAKWTQNSTS